MNNSVDCKPIFFTIKYEIKDRYMCVQVDVTYVQGAIELKEQINFIKLPAMVVPVKLNSTTQLAKPSR